jgi:two-component system, OmpR family, KDP operon response regulator KdpE
MSTEQMHKHTNALIVDDEAQIRRLLRIALEGSNYRVFEAATGKEGLLQAAQCRPEVILLDLGLPDMDGTDVLKRLREWTKVPVLILTVCDRESDKIAALDAGADDYVTKPFATGELLARVRAALRHSQPQGSDAFFRSGDLEVDLSARVVKKAGREVKLTPTEYSLLRLFVTHAGRVMTHRQILNEIWGASAVEQTQYLRVHIAHLREKLERDSSIPTLIVTEPGVGYRLVPEG